MSEVVKFPSMWIVALLVIFLGLILVIDIFFEFFIARNICKIVGSFILRSLMFGGVITGEITDIGIRTACDIIPF
jgi:hypothetical protein